jgi:signal transduction histidine kinase
LKLTFEIILIDGGSMKITGRILILVFVLSQIISCHQKVQTISNYEEIAKIAVHNTAVGLGAVLGKMDNVLDQIALMQEFITPIRFYPDETGYFYIYNYDCVNLAHATQKNLQGKDLTEFQDEKGKYVIQELSAVAKKGGGYVEYYWVKPGETAEFKKMGYVEPIPGTEYFIGTGVYLQ